MRGRALAALGFGLMLAGASPGLAQTEGPAPDGVAETPIVIGRSFALPSAIMGQTREINVWTPPGYAESGRTYPVLYVLDGGQDQDFHHISGLAQLGTIVGTMRDVIVVGVASKDRRNELAFRSSEADLIADYPTHGDSARFLRFLAEEVMPFIQVRYRTDGDDALMGESLAGLFVVETFLRQPDLFDRYIAISPSLWWDDGSLADRAPALLARHTPAPRTLWLTVADEGPEMETPIRAIADAVRNPLPAGLDAYFQKREGETHATTYHPAALDILRDVYSVPPQPAP